MGGGDSSLGILLNYDSYNFFSIVVPHVSEVYDSGGKTYD